MSLTTITSADRAARLGLFDHQGEDDHYEELRLGDVIWVKRFDARSETWQVARYSPESFARYKAYTEK